MTNAQRLKQRRLVYGKAAGLEKGYSQQQVATAVGISQGQYAAYEASGPRARRVPLRRLLRICAFYDVSLGVGFPEYRLTPEEREESMLFAGV